MEYIYSFANSLVHGAQKLSPVKGLGSTSVKTVSGQVSQFTNTKQNVWDVRVKR